MLSLNLNCLRDQSGCTMNQTAVWHACITYRGWLENQLVCLYWCSQEAVDHEESAWVPASHMGDEDGDAASGLGLAQPLMSGCCGHLATEEADERSLFVSLYTCVCVSFSVTLCEWVFKNKKARVTCKTVDNYKLWILMHFIRNLLVILLLLLPASNEKDSKQRPVKSLFIFRCEVVTLKSRFKRRNLIFMLHSLL